MPAIGVDISDESIKFLELAPRRTGKAIVVYGNEHLGNGVVVGGEIKNPQKLVAGLRNILNQVKPRFVRASLPEQKAYFFTTQVPSDASREKVLKLLEFQLEEHVPLSPVEAVVDYDRIPHPGSVHPEQVSVGVTVYPRETVEKYTEVFFSAGFFPLSFEIEAQSIERTVIADGDDGTYMVIDFGETSTGLAVVSRGMLSFTSTLDIAGSDLTKVIMEELGVKKEEVSNIKNTVGIMGISGNSSFTKRITEAAEKLGEEVKRHYKYWEERENQDGSKKKVIERVILCGGNANVKGLPEHLERELGISVERANVWRNVFSLDDVVPNMPYEISLSYATVVGLALRSVN